MSHNNSEITLSSFFLSAVFLCLLIGGCVPQVINSINYDIDVSGHLKRAADANSPEIALKELRTAIANIEKRKLTEGSTHIFYATPDSDLKFWYDNIKSATNDLDNLKEDSSNLEKTNMLMKLRESLLDHGEHGMSITQPGNVALYPNQINWFMWNLGCVVAFFSSIAYVLVKSISSIS